MILGFTGHRLKYFQGDPAHTKKRLYDMAVAVLKRYEPSKVVSGMEPTGWDIAVVARAAQDLDIPLIAAIPFQSHAKMYPGLLEYVRSTGEAHFINNDPYAAWKMIRRNEWIVDNCEQLIAVWNGQAGGTGHTWAYAAEVGESMAKLKKIRLSKAKFVCWLLHNLGSLWDAERNVKVSVLCHQSSPLLKTLVSAVVNYLAFRLVVKQVVI